MKPINVELTMGHNIGISASYYRPTEQEVLQDYLKAVDLLTINGERSALQKQVKDLKEKSKDSEFLIKAKVEEKEKEIQILYQKDSMNTDAIATLSDQLSKVIQEIEKLKTDRHNSPNSATL